MSFISLSFLKDIISAYRNYSWQLFSFCTSKTWRHFLLASRFQILNLLSFELVFLCLLCWLSLAAFKTFPLSLVPEVYNVMCARPGRRHLNLAARGEHGIQRVDIGQNKIEIGWIIRRRVIHEVTQRLELAYKKDKKKGGKRSGQGSLVWSKAANGPLRAAVQTVYGCPSRMARHQGWAFGGLGWAGPSTRACPDQDWALWSLRPLVCFLVATLLVCQPSLRESRGRGRRRWAISALGAQVGPTGHLCGL